MRLPNSAHTRRPWRIHEIAGDFHVEDVWAFRTPGAGPGDFPAMLAALEADSAKEPLLFRILFAVRWKLGALLGLDKPEAGVGARVQSLRERLPSELREAPPGSDAGMSPFTPVYELDDECTLEMANKTVHAVMHLGWAQAASSEYELRMASLVKPNGLLGRLYMAAITPFRRLFVVPAFTRQIERAWRNRDLDSAGVPESFRALSSLPAIDYVDRFTLPTSSDATPEQWARSMFGDVPDLAEQLIWRGLLGMRLSRGRSPGTVAGWRIAGRGHDWIRLEAASWFLTGNLVVQTTGGRVSLGTFVHYDRRLSHLVWPPLSAIHRRLAPGLLRDAAAKVDARELQPH